MYTVAIEEVFCATHCVRLAGGRSEAPHAHDWTVRVEFTRPHLDDVEMVIDFDVARGHLREVLSDLSGADLNSVDALQGLNPTAEVLARWVYDRLAPRSAARLRAVTITEAPGCTARYEPSPRMTAGAGTS